MITLEVFYTKFITEPNCGCWLWEDFLLDGYGQVYYEDSRIAAHRYSFILHKGPIPDGYLVCHTCDIRCCVNPDHLFVGTSQDNMNDMKRKGRSPNNKATNNPNSKLTWYDIEKIRLIGKSQSYKETSKLFNVTPEMISGIVRNKYWINK